MGARRGSIIEEMPRAPAGCELAARQGVPGEPSIERALALVLERAAAGYGSHGGWETRVRSALSALLSLFDEEPDLARLSVLSPEGAGSGADALREQTLRVLERRIDDGRHHAPRQPPPHAAPAVLAGAMGAIRARLLEPGSAPLSDLLDPLMSFIVLPYRGAAAARAQVTQADPLR
jgi:hypothetical protein